VPKIKTVPMSSAVAAPARRSGLAFASLKHRDFRFYVSGATLSMMADNIEHVITYWVLWETFHSPMLAGFAVISHWAPFLLLSVYLGAMADRYDCRRIIQASQALFMLVSISWGVLFLSGQLQMWNAMLLLSLHGLAGAIWTPAEQLMLHDIVGRDHLPSAVRLNATGRQLGIVLGPAVGGALLLFAGPNLGIFLNALIYLPLSLSLLSVRATGHKEGAEARKVSLGTAWQALAEAGSNRAIMSMIAMAGMAAFLIGTYTPQMPEFAGDFGSSETGLIYSMLLLASGAGAVLGGLLLELTGFSRVAVKTALGCVALWGISTAGFAITGLYPLALLFLFLAGASQLAFNSMAQTIVQLQAPVEQRGRLVGAFSMAQLGLRTGSGVSVGVVGSAIGIHSALAFSAALTTLLALGMLAYVRGAAAPAAAVLADGGELLLDADKPCC